MKDQKVNNIFKVNISSNIIGMGKCKNCIKMNE